MQKRERTTARILDAAATTFAKGGYAATSMDEIATAAGVSKLLLYRDFAGKKELYTAVLQRMVDRFDDVELSPGGAAIRALLDVARADPDGYLLLIRHAAREPEFAVYTSRIMELARHALAGHLRAFDSDGALRVWAADTAIRLTTEALLSWLRYGDPARDEEFCARVLNALRALVFPAEPDTAVPPATDS